VGAGAGQSITPPSISNYRSTFGFARYIAYADTFLKSYISEKANTTYNFEWMKYKRTSVLG
jgi:hypothetical protein